MNRFQPREAFTNAGSYELLPFQFMTFDDERKLVTNDAGDSLLLPNHEFDAFVTGRLERTADAYLDLKSRHFLFDSASRAPFELLVAKVRTRRAFLSGFTRLQIFVATLRCEHSCGYCQVSRVSSDRTRFDMSPDTAERSLDLAFSSSAESLKIEIQGGEPLLSFDVVRTLIEGAEARSTAFGKPIEIVVTTNLALINDEILDYFREHSVFVSTSLDGPADLHNANRPRPQHDSYERTIDGIRRVREALGDHRVAALMTTTRASLSRGRDVVDEYVRQRFRSIFLRPLSPYGFARRSARTTGYAMREFLDFYRDALAYLIDINARGVYLAESYAQILLTRIVTPFATSYVDLQSPAGAGIGVAVFNYDGDVYASDESRMLAAMGDTTFRLGNVHEQTYEQIFGGPLLRSLVESSVVESLPGCSDCALHPFCGADPIFNYATSGDPVIHVPGSPFHEKHFFLIKHLLHLYESDATARRVFDSWLGGVPLEAQ